MKAAGQYEPEQDQAAKDADKEQQEGFYDALKEVEVYADLRVGFPLQAHKMLIENCVKFDM